MAGFRIAAQQQDLIPNKRPEKRKDYLAFIRYLPCCVTGRFGVQAAHVSFASPWHGHFGRAKGTKAPDRFALPLTPEQHELQHSGKLGSEQAYWLHHGIDPHELANTLWGLFCDYEPDEAAVRCAARINQGLSMAGKLKGDA